MALSAGIAYGVCLTAENVKVIINQSQLEVQSKRVVSAGKKILQPKQNIGVDFEFY